MLVETEIEIDIEEELTNQERAHALAFCPEHEGLRPENGRIIQGLCSALFRVNYNSEADHCPKCTELFDIPKAGFCWVCGIPA
jgi:hypothetical protein